MKYLANDLVFKGLQRLKQHVWVYLSHHDQSHVVWTIVATVVRDDLRETRTHSQGSQCVPTDLHLFIASACTKIFQPPTSFRLVQTKDVIKITIIKL